MKVVDLGLKDYELTRDLQLETVEAIRRGKLPETLFLVEHPDVYTFGRKSPSSKLLFGDAKCVEVERGGEATFHNPGQLVAYPILDLSKRGKDVHAYLRNLEEVLIALLRDYVLDCEAVPGATGVWVKSSKKKIASIGVAVRHWITYHGIALNVSNDLSGFSKINPCGFSADIMTSLSLETGSAKQIVDVKKALSTNFVRIFS